MLAESTSVPVATGRKQNGCVSANSQKLIPIQPKLENQSQKKIHHEK
jgi:hypothetical protein